MGEASDRVPRRDPRGDRRGDGARRARSSSSARTSPPPAACSRSRRAWRSSFGRERVFDTPISELAISAGAFGAAVTGLRPIFEIMFADFLPLAMDSLVNQAAKYWYVSNEQGSVPAGGALGDGRRRQLRRDALAVADPLAAGDPGAEGRRAGDRGRRQGAAQGSRSATTTRSPSSSTSASTRSRTRWRARRRCRSARPPSSARAPTSPWSRSPRACATASRAADELAERRASTPRSSTCAACARSTSRPCSTRSRRPTAWSRSRRGR